MKYTPKKVFILEDGRYIELSYQEFSARCKSAAIYQEKKLIPLHGMLMEVTEDVYEDFCKSERRQRYLEECSLKNGEFSYNMLTTDDINGEDILVDRGPDVGDIVADRLMRDKLQEAVHTLPDDEQLLIYQYYYVEIPETELAGMYGISQQAVSKRISKIRAKLKKILEN